jgi:hypothetical protein
MVWTRKSKTSLNSNLIAFGVRASGVGSLRSVSKDATEGQGCPR